VKSLPARRRLPLPFRVSSSAHARRRQSGLVVSLTAQVAYSGEEGEPVLASPALHQRAPTAAAVLDQAAGLAAAVGGRTAFPTNDGTLVRLRMSGGDSRAFTTDNGGLPRVSGCSPGGPPDLFRQTARNLIFSSVVAKSLRGDMPSDTFQIAAERAAAAYGADFWLTLSQRERCVAVYRELRKLDQQARRGVSTEPPEHQPIMRPAGTITIWRCQSGSS
jgi:hypothetical protein